MIFNKILERKKKCILTKKMIFYIKDWEYFLNNNEQKRGKVFQKWKQFFSYQLH